MAAEISRLPFFLRHPVCGRILLLAVVNKDLRYNNTTFGFSLSLATVFIEAKTNKLVELYTVELNPVLSERSH
jgi:hypothetical protein